MLRRALSKGHDHDRSADDHGADPLPTEKPFVERDVTGSHPEDRHQVDKQPGIAG
jgi:hypothetical protein